ncbi:MAG: hypothetical protein ACKV1O_07305 [Saprospiraceae bacterium]
MGMLTDFDKVLEQNRCSPYVVRFDADFDLSDLADKIEQDEKFDLNAVIDAHKIPNPHATA